MRFYSCAYHGITFGHPQTLDQKHHQVCMFRTHLYEGRTKRKQHIYKYVMKEFVGGHRESGTFKQKLRSQNMSENVSIHRGVKIDFWTLSEEGAMTSVDTKTALGSAPDQINN